MNLDIWRSISLYLQFNCLNLNRELSIIYDQSWFKDKLTIQYSDIISKHNNSWEWLYKRSLKSGQIFRYNEDKNIIKKLCPINAIKISEIRSEWILSLKEDLERYKINMILTFDGDLHTFYKLGKYIGPTLIDTNVIDIDDNTYIKNNEWYVFPERRKRELSDKILVISSTTNFLAVASEDNFVAAITKDYFYCYNINTGYLRIHNWLDNVNLIFSGDFIIQKSDGSLIKYDPRYDISTKLEVGIVKNIYSGCIKLLDNSLKVISKYHSPNLKDELSFYNINNENNDFSNSIFNCGKPFLLIDNNVYSAKNLVSNNDKNLLLIHENVKNICGSFDIYFII